MFSAMFLKSTPLFYLFLTTGKSHGMGLGFCAHLLAHLVLRTSLRCLVKFHQFKKPVSRFSTRGESPSRPFAPRVPIAPPIACLCCCSGMVDGLAAKHLQAPYKPHASIRVARCWHGADTPSPNTCANKKGNACAALPSMSCQW